MDAEQRAAELFDAENPIDVKKAGVNAALMRAAAIRAITRALTQAQPGWRVVAQLSVGRQSVDACKLSNTEMTDAQVREILGLGLHDLYAAAPAPQGQGKT